MADDTVYAVVDTAETAVGPGGPSFFQKDAIPGDPLSTTDDTVYQAVDNLDTQSGPGSSSFYERGSVYQNIDLSNTILIEVQAEAARVEAIVDDIDADAAAAHASQVAAAASQAAAAASAVASAASAAASLVSQNAAAASATAAATSATNAAASAATATSAATTATTQAGIATTQAGIATTQAVIATTQASNASTSATAAAASAAAALVSQNAASASATAAAASAAAALVSQGAASTSATNASTSAAAAASSDTSASGSATTATTQAGNASTSATAAAASAAAAATSATGAGDSATNAAASATAAATSYDNFDDRWLGPKASDPTTDNDGNAILTGAVYFNTASTTFKVWNGSAWGAPLSGAPDSADYLVKTANGSLSAERVVTDNESVVWDWATSGQVKAIGVGNNLIVNPLGQHYQSGLGSKSDATYDFDQWLSLSEANPVTVSQLTLVEDGMPFAMRSLQANASSQRFGRIQWLESVVSQSLRGRAVVMSARVRTSASTTLRYALVEWTGTADSITKDVVNNWSSGTFTAGNFFTSTSTTVVATGSVALTAATFANISLTGTVSSSANNLALLTWTDSARPQNDTLDVSKVKLELGDVATTFAGHDLFYDAWLCARYYNKSYANTVAPGTSGTTSYAAFQAYGTGGESAGSYSFGARMRTVPTVTFYSPNSGTGGRIFDANGSVDEVSFGPNSTNQSGFSGADGSRTLNRVYRFDWTASARL